MNELASVDVDINVEFLIRRFIQAIVAVTAFAVEPPAYAHGKLLMPVELNNLDKQLLAATISKW